MPLKGDSTALVLIATTKSVQTAPYTQNFDKIDDALAFYKQELKARIELVGEHHMQVAYIRDYMAVLFQFRGKDYFEKAEKNLKKALEIRKTYFGAESKEVALYLDTISDFYFVFGYYQKCIELLNSSKAIKVKVFGKDSFELGRTTGKLAEVHRKMGKYTEAELYFQEALPMLEKADPKFGKENPAVGDLYRTWALSYRQQSMKILIIENL
jgi:tetratricopeptide (TPR) repeat protein